MGKYNESCFIFQDQDATSWIPAFLKKQYREVSTCVLRIGLFLLLFRNLSALYKHLFQLS